MTTPVTAEITARLPWHRQLGPRCAVGVARLLILLSPANLQRLLRILSRRAVPASHEEAARARQAAVSVSARCAGLGCLQRSVATVLMCRAKGRWADWCTGFRTQPFAAHAWVEAEGRPVGEPGELCMFRAVLSVRCPAGSGS
jgi:hypothetical protein